MRRISVVAGTVSLLAAFLGSAQAAPVFYGPTAYLSSADSPFAAMSFSYFHLEDFEDHLLNTPGVTANVGGVTTTQGFSGSIIDSVDNDDGTIDGTCAKVGANCDSYFSGIGTAGILFTFDANVLGALPTHVGIVWTDGTDSQIFEAFDAQGNSLGTRSGSTADGNNFFGGTGEDAFYGVSDAGGISAILMRSGAGGIEVDHLQYGLVGAAPPTGVPEPLTLTLFGAGLAGAAAIRRRRNKA